MEFEGTSKLEGEMKEWGVMETTTATGSSLMECQSHDIWPNVISSHIKVFYWEEAAEIRRETEKWGRL